MSAWIVSERHIDLMVATILRSEAVPEAGVDANAIGRTLWTENLRSVAYRYPDDRSGERPGPIGFRDVHAKRYTFTPIAELPTDPAFLAKQFACYRYQSCEHPSWQRSNAQRWTKKLLRMWGTGVERTREYNVAPWGIDDDDDIRRVLHATG